MTRGNGAPIKSLIQLKRSDMMKSKIAVVLSALSLVCGASRATSFEVPVSGVYNASFDPSSYPEFCDPNAITCTIHTDFSGLMNVYTPSGANGTYSADIGIEYQFNNDDLVYLSSIDVSSWGGYASATVTAGKLTELAFLGGNFGETLTLSDGMLTWTGEESHAGANASGSYLLPSVVPEPASSVLLGLGVGVIALFRRRVIQAQNMVLSNT